MKAPAAAPVSDGENDRDFNRRAFANSDPENNAGKSEDAGDGDVDLARNDQERHRQYDQRALGRAGDCL